MRLATFDQHLEAIAVASARLAPLARSAGIDAPVPTCPRWSVAHLVAHQGMVHRWATANVRGEDTATPSVTELLRTIPHTELVAWFDDGATVLLETLRAARPELHAAVFLHDAPPPRDFWARRQAHETTIHAVDALAADLGRLPTAAEAAIGRDLAVDGIDELLRGFVTRGKGRLPAAEPWSIGVRPDDADRAWLLRVAPGEPIVTERVSPGSLPAPDPSGPDATFTGSAAQLYLGLWNRGAEIEVVGRAGALDDWHGSHRIRW